MYSITITAESTEHLTDEEQEAIYKLLNDFGLTEVEVSVVGDISDP